MQRDDDKTRTSALVSQLNNLKLQMKRTDMSKGKEVAPGGLYYNLESARRAARAGNKDSGTGHKVPKRRTILSIP